MNWLKLDELHVSKRPIHVLPNKTIGVACSYMAQLAFTPCVARSRCKYNCLFSIFPPQGNQSVTLNNLTICILTGRM